jgi:xylulokinase
MVRAIMEGVAYSQRDCLEVFHELKVPFAQMAATGGGGKSKFWRQMIADVLDCPITTISNNEGAALGAALLAGVGVGVYKDLPSACDSIIHTSGTQAPDKDRHCVYDRYFALYREVYIALSVPFKALAGM